MSVQRNNLSRLAELNATVFLTGVHPADLLDEGLVKPRDYGAPNWYHEVLVQALNEGIYPSNTSSLTKGKKNKTKQTVIPLFVSKIQNDWLHFCVYVLTECEDHMYHPFLYL